jgi:hypothetical protein
MFRRSPGTPGERYDCSRAPFGQDLEVIDGQLEAEQEFFVFGIVSGSLRVRARETFYRSQTKARTSAVVTAARATATSTGARNARAMPATPTPMALSSSTRC